MKVILIFITLFASNYAYTESKNDNPLLGIYLKYCKGDNKEANKEIDSIISQDPSHIQALLLRLKFNPSEMDDQINKYWGIYKAGNNGGNEFQKLMLAYALILHRFDNIDEIERILNFVSNNKYLEAERLSLLNHINYIDNPDKAFIFAEKAYQTLPYFSPSYLYSIIVKHPNDPALKTKRETYISDKAYVNLQDPYNKIIEYTIGLKKRNLYDKDTKLSNLVRETYQSCTPDPDLLLYYVAELCFGDEKYEDVLTKASGISDLYQYYSPSFDLIIAVSAIRTYGWKDMADKHAMIAAKSYKYLTKSERKILKTYTTTKASIYITYQEHNIIILGLVVVIMFAIIYIVFIIRYKKEKIDRKKKNVVLENENLIDNPQELEEAEKALKGKNKNLAVIAKYDSGQGFKESDMIRIIVTLGAEGISAEYDSHSAGLEMGAITYYYLKVHKEDAEQAVAIIKEKNL